MSSFYKKELDYAKGIGIFAVVLCHAIPLNGGTEFIDISVNQWIYAFHMPLFFIISGIGFGLKENVAKKKIRRICEHLLKPYFIWSLLYVAIYVAGSIVLHKGGISSYLAERAYARIT